MKKIFSSVICLFLVLCLGTACFADAIATPYNSFVDHHREECHIHAHYYVAVKGSVAQQSPHRPFRAFELREGYVYRVSYSYTDGRGVEWGCIAQNNDPSEKHGWIPLEALRPIYDAEYFFADRKDEIVYEDAVADLSRGAVLYEYPGSPLKWVVGPEKIYEDATLHGIWTDENGVSWATYFGDKGEIIHGTADPHLHWICLDNPLAGFDLAVNSGSVPVTPDPNAPKIKGLPPCDDLTYLNSTVPEPFVPRGGRLLIFTLALTLAAAAGATGLALVLKKKN